MRRSLNEKIADFVDGLPRHLKYSEIEAAIRKRFGSPYGWTAERIRTHCVTTHRQGQFSKIEADAEIKAFVEDRIGRRTLAQLHIECASQFGHDRAPSRSALHRYYSRLRGNPIYPKPLKPRRR